MDGWVENGQGHFKKVNNRWYLRIQNDLETNYLCVL